METQDCNPSYASPHWALYSLPAAVATFVAPQTAALVGSLLFLTKLASPTKEWHSNPKFRHLKLHFYEGAMVGFFACAARSLLRIEVTRAIGNLVGAAIASVAAKQMRASTPPPPQPTQPTTSPAQPKPQQRKGAPPPELMEHLTRITEPIVGKRHGEIRMFNAVVKFWNAETREWVNEKPERRMKRVGTLSTLPHANDPWTN